MRNYQKNATITHRTEKKDLAGSFYEDIFIDGAIGGKHNTAIVECLSKESDSMGGYLVPDSMEKKIIHSLKENNVIRRLATVIRTDGSDRHIPLAATMSDAQWLGESAAIQLAEAAFSGVRFKQHKLGMMIQVSNELINDGGVDMPAFLSEAFAEQIASTEENAFINGNGVDMPKGLLASSSAGIGVTAQATDVITAEELISLYYSLDEKYRQHAVFMMHEDTAKALRLLKDENGHYLWREALGGEPDRLLGRPAYISRFMPKMVAGAKPVLFGDLSKYWIADRGNRSFRRFDELFADQGQTGFRMIERIDSKLILPEAVKVIQMAE